MGEVAFPKERHTNWLSGVKRPALKSHIGAALYRLNRFYN